MSSPIADVGATGVAAHTYELRHNWTGQTTLSVLGGFGFASAGFVPSIWTGRIRLDGILMPAGFLPVMRVVAIVLFGGAALFALWRALTRPLIFRVDGAGIAFGNRAASLMSWTEVRGLDLFVRTVQQGRRKTSTPYLGVYRLRDAPAVAGASRQAGVRSLAQPDGTFLIAACRQLAGARLDVNRFSTAVRYHRPELPITVRPDFPAA